jgi:hypothetical protein
MPAEGAVKTKKNHQDQDKDKTKPCHHETVSITWHPETGQEMTRRCSQTPGCGEQLALGKARGKPNAVELRAASLAAGARSRKIERLGMSIHAVDCEGINDDCPVTVCELNDLEAGWLCHEIRTHDGDREIRDACSYSWDISRPIADQVLEIKGQYNALGTLYYVVAMRTGDSATIAESVNVRGCLELVAVNLEIGDEPEQGLEIELRDTPTTREVVEFLDRRKEYIIREQCSRCGRQESPTCCDILPDPQGAKPEADLVEFDAKLTSLASADAASSLIDTRGLKIASSRMTGEELDESRISDAALATIAHAPSRQPTAARIERALREIGCHHTPSPGWEDRVNATDSAEPELLDRKR